MTELARTEKDPELRREAIRSLGMMGAKGDRRHARRDLPAPTSDPAVKKAIIQALSLQDNAAALVAIARKEADPAMKRDIVQKLSDMGDNKIATDYMLELLSGK